MKSKTLHNIKQDGIYILTHEFGVERAVVREADETSAVFVMQYGEVRVSPCSDIVVNAHPRDGKPGFITFLP